MRRGTGRTSEGKQCSKYISVVQGIGEQRVREPLAPSVKYKVEGLSSLLGGERSVESVISDWLLLKQ
jgi:hypothetical protein